MADEAPKSSREVSPDRELLLGELRENRMDTRTFFQLVVGWFTFFLSVMLAAIAWSAKAASEGIKNHRVIEIVATFFVAQIGLGLIVCVVIRSYLTRSSAARERMEASLANPRAPRVTHHDLDVSNRFMRHVIVVMMVTLVVYAIAWIVLPRAI